MPTKRQPNDNHMTTRVQPNVNIEPTKWRQVDNQITTMRQPPDNRLTTKCQRIVCVEELSVAEHRLFK